MQRERRRPATLEPDDRDRTRIVFVTVCTKARRRSLEPIGSCRLAIGLVFCHRVARRALRCDAGPLTLVLLTGAWRRGLVGKLDSILEVLLFQAFVHVGADTA